MIFQKHSYRVVASLIVLYLSMNTSSFADEFMVETGENPETKLKYWLFDAKGFLLKLTQRLPDQTRAYFEARGFDQASADLAATSCFFQTMVKNSGTVPGSIMKTELSDWKIVTTNSRNKIRSMLLRDYWQKVWQEKKQPRPARIAFEWSLLPSSINYDVNDYNWGMSSYGLMPGSRFDLQFSWMQAGKSYKGEITNLHCPDDIHPTPPPE